MNTDVALPDVIPEVDKTDPLAIAITLCTGRTEVEHPVNEIVAQKRYVHYLTMAFRQDLEYRKNADAHIRKIDWISRRADGTMWSVISTLQQIPSCQHMGGGDGANSDPEGGSRSG